MRKGELSNDVLPRVYIVFEGLVGILPDAKSKVLEGLARKRRKWAEAVDQYQLNLPTSGGLRDLYWRHRFRVDVVTFIDPKFVEPIRSKLDSRNVLFGDVHYYTTPFDLAQDLVYDPAIIGVLDGDPARILTYGAKGRYCPPNQLDLLKILI